MTLNKMTFVLTGMFVTGAVFFTILLRRSEQLRQEVHQLRERRSISG
jgi:preprotein translocase subunit SecG